MKLKWGSRMARQPRKTSKPSDSTGGAGRATGQPPIESEGYQNFLESLRAGRRIKLPKDLVPLSQDDPRVAEFMPPIRLRSAIRALRDGIAIDQCTAKWLARALEECMANPSTSADSLGINRDAGRPVTLGDQRHLDLALDFYTLRVKMGLTLKDTKSGFDVMAMISKTRHVTPGTVEKSWQEWGTHILSWAALYQIEST